MNELREKVGLERPRNSTLGHLVVASIFAICMVVFLSLNFPLKNKLALFRASEETLRNKKTGNSDPCYNRDNTLVDKRLEANMLNDKKAVSKRQILYGSLL